MLVLKDAFYKWLTKDSISDKECRQILEAIDGICKEITTDELQFIHRIIEERCIDIGYALSKYHFFSNIPKNARITNEYEVISISWENLAVELPLIILGYTGRKKTVLQKYNEFLFAVELPTDILKARSQNYTYTFNLIHEQWFRPGELEKELGVSRRTIKRWKAERISQHKENQICENPRNEKPIGPRFGKLGKSDIYFKEDVEAYINSLR